VGANFGGYASLQSDRTPLSGPFLYQQASGSIAPGKPVKSSEIRRPSDCMAFIEARTFYIHAPLHTGWGWDYNADNDLSAGPVNSCSALSGYGPYNVVVAKIHGKKGNNVGLFDGHVEYVPYRLLWATTPGGKILHRFWALQQ
jgi:prepilin-type processing-associated H-X9-DG protein